MLGNPNNPFDLFNIEQTYFINQDLLLKKYILLQKQFHPDNYVNKTTQEKLMATQISSNISTAYKKLLDPIEKASILLNLAEYEFSIDTFKNTNPSILLEQMEIREQIDLADKDELAKIKTNLKIEFEILETKFTNNLNNNNEQAAQNIIEMRFYQKVIEEI